MATRANIVVRHILPLRGNTAQSEGYTGLVGEITVDTELDTLRIHDGNVAGGRRLATYAELESVASGGIDLSGYATSSNLAATNANVTAANAVVASLRANIGAFHTYANATFSTGASSTYSNTNVAAYLVANPQGSTYSNVNVQAYLGANVGAYQTWANAVLSTVANAGSQQTQINSINANVTAANTAIDAVTTAWTANAATQGGLITSNYNTLIANAAFAHSEIDGLRANITASNVTIASLQSNAGTQQTQIDSINANVAAANAAIAAIQTGSGFATVDQITANIATVTSNAATQATQINSTNANVTAANSAITALQTQVYDNTNAAAYLAGNVTVGNLTVSTDAVVLGNLRVQGTQTTVNAATLSVDDLWVTVANGAAQASDANGAGIRVAGALANIAYSSTTDSFNFNKPITVDKLFTSNITSGTQYWTFGTDGRLAIPPATFEIGHENYTGITFSGNNTPKYILDDRDGLVLYLGNTGSAQWKFDTDGNLKLPGVNNNGLVFNYSGTSFDFTRIAAEGVLTNPSLVIRTGDINTDERHAWSFSSTGNLTFPDATVFSGNTTTLPNGQGFNWKFYDPMVGSDTVNLYMNGLTTGYDSWALTTGNGTNSWVLDSSTQEFSLFNGGVDGGKLVFGTAANAGVRSSIDDIELKSGTGNVFIRANAEPWTFREDGNLVLPSNMNFSTSPAVSGTGIIFGDGSYQYTAWTGAPGNRLVNGAYTVGLDTAGNLTVPASILPTVDNTQDLGSATMRFRHLYVGPGTVYVGNAAIKTTATGNLILPGLTRAIASTAYAEEVDDEGDQTQTFTTVPTVIDNAYYSYLNGNPDSLSFTAAEYSVDQLDGEGYIDGISIDSRGSGYADQVARLADQDMWATEAADPVNNFSANDWVQIPFRVQSRAGESEYEFGTGGDSSDRLVNDSYEVVLDSDGHINLPGGSIRQAADEDLVIRVKDADNDGYRLDLIVVDDEDNTLTRLEVHRDGVEILANLQGQTSHGWYFKDDGSTQFPSDTIKAPLDQPVSLSDNAGKNFVTVTDTQVVISVQDTTEYEWIFGQDGSITFPDATVQTTAYTGGGGNVSLPGLATSGSGTSNVAGTPVYTLGINTESESNDGIELIVYAGGDNASPAISIGQNNGGSHRANVIAIGNYDVGYNSLPGGVYIGYGAGYNNQEQPQGLHSIAIGSKAAWDFATNNSITINATGDELNPDESGLFIKPIRAEEYDDVILYYNPDSGEVTYANNTGTSALVTVGNTASGTEGSLWYNTDDGRTYVYALDTWIDASPAVVPGNMVGYDTDGNITLRDDASINYANGTSIINSVYGDTEVANFLDAYTGNIAKIGSTPLGITATSIKLNSDNETWSFNNSGVMIFPDGSEQTTAYTGGGSSYGNTQVSAFLNDYEGNIYINSESSGLIIDAAGDRRVGFMKYFGIESSFVHANGPTKSVPFRIGRVAADDITQANLSVFTTEVYIAANGKIGVNTTGPTEQLDVNGVIRARGSIYARPGSSYGVYFTETGTSSGSITTDVDDVMQVNTSGGFVVGASGNQRLLANLSTTILSAGNDLTIKSNTSFNTNTWTFGATGNLVIPNNGGILYANGTNILSSVPSTGNITFDGSDIITSDSSITLQVPNSIPTGVANWEGQGGWNQGFYGDVATTGGTGTGLTVDVAAGGGGYINIEAITINNPGSGYTNGDVITIDNENNLPGTFTLIVPTQNWNFGANGVLTTPGSVTMAAGGRFITNGNTGITASHWYNYPNTDHNWFARFYSDESANLKARLGLENLSDITIETTSDIDGLDNSGPDHKWKFNGDGSMTFPDTTVQTTAWSGNINTASGYINFTSSPAIGTSGITFADASHQTTAFTGLASNLRIGRAAPTVSTGGAGDLLGAVAADENHLYYAIDTYGNSSYYAVTASGNNGSVYNHDVAKGDYPRPQTDWTLNIGGAILSPINSVTDGGTYWRINTNASTPYSSGQGVTLTGNSGTVWKSVPLNSFQTATTGTYANANVAAYLTTGVTTANLTIAGNVVQQSAYYETFSNVTNSGGNLTCNFVDGSTFYATLTANVTVNFTNVVATAGRVTGATLIVDQGATPYGVANIQIDGGGVQTIKWAGGTGVNTGTASNTDVMSFSLISLDGTSWRILGQIGNYG